MEVIFTQEELTNIRKLHNLEEEVKSLHVKTNNEMELDIYIEAYIDTTEERIYVDCPEDVNYRISKKLKQGEIK
jgi:ABC-type lipoprotein release transport system permease subunit